MQHCLSFPMVKAPDIQGGGGDTAPWRYTVCSTRVYDGTFTVRADCMALVPSCDGTSAMQSAVTVVYFMGTAVI